MPNIIIGFAGKKQSGKTTAANIIKSIYGDRVILLNFGDAVKKSLKAIFNFSDDELYGDKKEVINEYWGITPRDIMQYYATELMRVQLNQKYKSIGNNIWVKSLECQINQIFNDYDDKIIIIGDLRFKNEYEMIKKYDGITIRINKKSEDNDYSNHISEHDLDDVKFDCEIDNNGTIEEFKKEIKQIMEIIFLYDIK